MPPPAIIDPKDLDLSTIVVDLEQIRKVNPQRYEMEQLTAIVLIDEERNIIAGYKDLKEDEWWVPGHIPGRPLMPGVLMIEAAAQLCGYYYYVLGHHSGFLGFAAVDEVKFRNTVPPGSRLVTVGRMRTITKRKCVFEAQSFVDDKMVFEATVTGMII